MEKTEHVRVVKLPLIWRLQRDIIHFRPDFVQAIALVTYSALDVVPETETITLGDGAFDVGVLDGDGRVEVVEYVVVGLCFPGDGVVDEVPCGVVEISRPRVGKYFGELVFDVGSGTTGGLSDLLLVEDRARLALPVGKLATVVGEGDRVDFAKHLAGDVVTCCS